MTEINNNDKVTLSAIKMNVRPTIRYVPIGRKGLLNN
jgi:hypothetical protein